MTLAEARNILGLTPDEDPCPHLEEIRSAREKIAVLVRTAPNETLALRYQEGLAEFDRAIAAVREHMESVGLEDPADFLARPSNEKPFTSAAPAVVTSVSVPQPERRGRSLAWLVWLLVFVIGIAAGGFYYYNKNEEEKVIKRKERIALLERTGAQYLESRRWQEASQAFAEIDSLSPGSELARLGHRSIEAGMAEEQHQFVGYWTGQAIAGLEAGRLDEAQAAANQVLAKFPGEKDAATILEKIKGARATQARETALAAARKQFADHDWDGAIASAKRILTEYPQDADASTIIADATAVLAKRDADRKKALELLARAVSRDQGKFDKEALECLREAAALAPDNKEIAARFEKMASYTRTLRVPEDYATPAEALADAHDRDRIVLTEKTWKGPLFITAAVEIQGAGSGKTIIECPAADGSPLSISPEAKGARVTGITFRHETFQAVGAERYASVVVRGGGATFTDCVFRDASGHGLAVIENGEVAASHCKFNDNGWDGASVNGKGSRLEVRDSEALNNFEHGFESWEGASITLANNRCEGNSRNGIHVDGGGAGTVVEGNQLVANREFGLVLDSAGTGKVSENTVRANLLGGMVVRKAAAAVTVTGNTATLNQGPGIVIEKGLPEASYTHNTASKNSPQDILTNANLDGQEGKTEVVPKVVVAPQ